MTPDEVHVVCYGFEKLKNHLYIHAAKTGDFLHKILVKYTGKELPENIPIWVEDQVEVTILKRIFYFI